MMPRRLAAVLLPHFLSAALLLVAALMKTESGAVGGARKSTRTALCVAAGLLLLVPHHGHAYLVWRSGAIPSGGHLLARCPPLLLHSRPSAPCASLRLKLRSDPRSPHAAAFDECNTCTRARARALARTAGSHGTLARRSATIMGCN